MGQTRTGRDGLQVPVVPRDNTDWNGTDWDRTDWDGTDWDGTDWDGTAWVESRIMTRARKKIQQECMRTDSNRYCPYL